MSKFDFELMSNEDDSVVCFNKQRWSRNKALEQAKIELESIYDLDNTELEVIEGYVQYGFWRSPDGELVNNWFCPNLNDPSFIKNINQVPVWIVRVVDEVIVED